MIEKLNEEHIMIITTIFCPIVTQKDDGGGIKSTIALLNGLDNLGYHTIVMLDLSCNFTHKFNKTIQIEYFEKKPVVSLKNIPKFLKTSNFVNNFIKNNKLENQIILCSDRPALMLLNFEAKKYANIIYISRGLPYITLSALLLRKIVFPYIKQYVGISKRQVEILKPYLKSNQKITHIHNGIKLLDFKKQNLFESKTITMIIIGGICELKNQMQAIEVTELLSKKYSVQLKIYGSTFTHFDEAYKKNLENYIAKNNLKNIYFMGYNSNLEDVFTDADILISASVSEGFGRTIIEGMSCGIPVVANEIAGAPTEIITNNVDGILYNGSLKALEESVIKIIENKNFRDKIVENAMEKVKNNFTENTMSKKYALLIENMLHEN